MIKFVVTGAPRASTKWTARMLTSVGMDCGHEDICNRWGKNFSDDGVWRSADVLGECSWQAAPFAHDMSEAGVKVVHLVRHPLTSVRSLAGGGINLNGGSVPFHRFIATHIGDIWSLGLDEPNLCLEFWKRWNEQLLGISDLTWIAPAHGLDVRQLYGMVGGPPLRDEWAATALPPINARERASVQVSDLDPDRWQHATALYAHLVDLSRKQ